MDISPPFPSNPIVPSASCWTREKLYSSDGRISLLESPLQNFYRVGNKRGLLFMPSVFQFEMRANSKPPYRLVGVSQVRIARRITFIIVIAASCIHKILHLISPRFATAVTI